jgi:hypothetical protein
MPVWRVLLLHFMEGFNISVYRLPVKVSLLSSFFRVAANPVSLGSFTF